MSGIRFRCSSLALIMTDAKSIDESLLTDEIAAIARKTKKTDEEKQLIQGLLDQSLSAGAKTHLEATAKEYIYGFNEVVTGKYMEKGIIVEEQAIELYNSVFFTSHVKNTERRSNQWITGEPDIVVPGVKGIDVKSSWSLATFPATAMSGADKTYEWQMRGYMMLFEAPLWEVAYCLVNTPDELIKYEQIDLHYVDHIDEALRVTRVLYHRDLLLEEKIKIKATQAQKFLDKIAIQISLEHEV